MSNSNAIVHVGGPFTSETARLAGLKSARVRRKMRALTEQDVLDRLGNMETPEDALRQLAALNILGLCGKVSGAAHHASVRACEVFLRYYHDTRGDIIQALREENERLREQIARLTSGRP